MDLLQEAHAPEGFLGKVQGLHQGEVAVLKGGVGVKRKALEDGRDAYQVGRPGYSNGEMRFDGYGDHHRSPEDATRAAFRASAASTDPESIGGRERLSYGVLHGGREVRIEDWTTDGKAIVRHADSRMPGNSKTVSPAELTRRPPVLYESDRLAEAKESLDRSPKKNWVENRGGLPQAIVHMAKDIAEERGKPLDQAIPIAISQAKKLAAKGNAKYVAAVAQWEKMKAQEAALTDSPFLPPIQEK